MTKEYEAYLKDRQISPPVEGEEFLSHYGVKGQKWGVRNYQYADGGYTPAGAERYWGGTGQGRSTSGGVQASGPSRIWRNNRSNGRSGWVSTQRPKVSANRNSRPQLTPEQRAARRARTKKILGITAGVAVAAAIGYGAYKGYQKSGEWQEAMRADVRRNMDGDFSKVNTLSSKYWDSADRRKYTELTRQHADYVANNITRRDAAAAKLAEKTGIRIGSQSGGSGAVQAAYSRFSSKTGIRINGIERSRERALEQRHEQNAYSNFIREADRRGHLNQQISEARKELRNVQARAERSDATRSSIQNEKYGDMWRQQHEKTIQMQRERLNNLLEQRRKAS